MIRIRRIRANNFKQLQEIDLVFPLNGRFLIEGKNEAGKSTLFEAVYFGIFGRGLVMEGRKLESLVGYGVEEAYVEIWLDAPEREIRIRRTIARGRSNTWELDILGDDGSFEEISGNRIVNDRIVEELGFDGDALLNTTFVEQKKLDKLEGMNRSQREQSLMKLLNLERMTWMIEHFRIRREDDQILKRLQDRFELAQIQKDLPGRKAELEKVKETLLQIHLRHTLDEMSEQRGIIYGLQRDIEALEQEAQKWQERVRHLSQLANARQELELLRKDHRRANELHKQILETKDQIVDLDQLSVKVIPQLEQKHATLQRLSTLLQSLISTEKEHASLEETIHEIELQIADSLSDQERVARLRDEVRNLSNQLNNAQERLTKVEQLQRDERVRETLTTWIDAKKALAAPAQKKAALAEAQERYLSMRRRVRREKVILGVGVILTAAAAVEGFVAAALVVFAIILWRLIRISKKSGAISSEISRIEGEQRAYEAQSEQNQERLKKAEERLLSLDVPIPQDTESASVLAEELAESLAQFQADSLAREADAKRTELATIKAQLDERSKAVEALEAKLASIDLSELEKQRERCREEMEHVQQRVLDLKSETETKAKEAGVETNIESVQAELGKVDTMLTNAHKQVEGRGVLANKLRALEDERKKLLGHIRDRYNALRKEHGYIPAWNDDDGDGMLSRAYGAIDQEYAQLKREDPQGQVGRLHREIGEKRGEINTRQSNLQGLVQKARRLLEQYGCFDTLPELEEGEIVQVYKAVQDAPLDEEPTWVKRRDDLSLEIQVLRERKEQLEGSLSSEGEQIDLEQARREFKSKESELQVRKRAVQIVRSAQKRVVEKVLPATMEQMRALLPVLTMERYFDAELTDDYHIRVWDERARDWKQKNIFSGGTKDQFSLALRLAFALATLPSEHGSAPSFLFLDEPLSSFDDERAHALLHLLTDGTVARSFDQIFLTSHVRVDPALFDYHILMRDGRVAETDMESTIPNADVRQGTDKISRR